MPRLRPVLLATLVAGLGLSGSAASLFALHRVAATSLERTLEERLRGAGESAALVLRDKDVSGEMLLSLMRTNSLDGAWIVGPGMSVLADATGPARPRVDLLRLDRSLLREAFRGSAQVRASYTLGTVRMLTGYFPLRLGGEQVRAVLALEAGNSFSAAREALGRALWVGLGLGGVGAAAVALFAFGWTRAEQRAHAHAVLASRSEALSQMAAVAAHEIRNPLGVIWGTVELLQERGDAYLQKQDQEDLRDILSEVERLRRLTEDLMDLARDRPLQLADVDLSESLTEAARATERVFLEIQVQVEAPEGLLLQADGSRLRQVFQNLLNNAAEAQGKGTVIAGAREEGKGVRIWVVDHGPGVSDAIRERLFEPFATDKARGHGLGLALSRRIIERHGGRLELARRASGETRFEVLLPRVPRGGG